MTKLDEDDVRPGNSRGGERSHPDLDVRRILCHPLIAAYLKKYPQYRAETVRAAEKLKSYIRQTSLERIAVGVIKAMDAVRSGRINVFFSYRSTDVKIARKVVDALGIHGNLNITFADDFKKTIVGQKYEDIIYDSVDRANIFILLLPDPSEEYYWPLFETGRFAIGMVPGDRLICLHHPLVTVPSPIERFQTVPATEEAVRGFLEGLFAEDDYLPGMKRFSGTARIDLMTEEICSAISALKPPLEVHHYDDYLVLEVEKPPSLLSLQFLRDPQLSPLKASIPDYAQLSAAEAAARLEALIFEKNFEILGKARVQHVTDGALRIFGKARPAPATWGELIESMPDRGPGARWMKELCDALRAAGTGNDFRRIFATLREVDHGGGRVFRPVLFSSPKRGKQWPTVFHIGLLPDVASMQVTHLPAGPSALLTSVRLAHRFLWEVVEKVRAMPEGRLNFDEIEGSIERITDEASSSGLLDPGLLTAAFRSARERLIIDTMYERWAQLYNDAGSGVLNLAFKDEDEAAVRKVMTELAGTNRTFLQMALRQLNLAAGQSHVV